MGVEVARAAAALGHRAVLVAGPCKFKTHDGIERVDVVSARDMKAAVDAALASPPGPDVAATVFVATAAVADWRPAETAQGKLKKSQMSDCLRLVRNPDILAEADCAFKVGFAAETSEDLEEARRKCRDKGAKLIVLNDVTAQGAGFGSRTNKATFVTPDGMALKLPLLSKQALAKRIVRFCEEACSRPQVFVLNGWAASEGAWAKCRFKRDRIFSYRDHLDGTTLAAFDAVDRRRGVVLVGWSMGGAYALELAMRNPGKVRGLVLVAATPRMMRDDNWPGMTERRIEALSLGLKTTRAAGGDEAAAYEPDSDENLAAGLDHLRRLDLRQALENAKDSLRSIPTVILQSLRDPIVRRENADFLETVFAGCAHLYMVDSDKHALQLEVPEFIDITVERLFRYGKL